MVTLYTVGFTEWWIKITGVMSDGHDVQNRPDDMYDFVDFIAEL